jgi:hypothetical protein
MQECPRAVCLAKIELYDAPLPLLAGGNVLYGCIGAGCCGKGVGVVGIDKDNAGLGNDAHDLFE